jgi:hypothetical protein
MHSSCKAAAPLDCFQVALDTANSVLNTALPQVYEDAAAVDHAMVQKHAPVGGAGYTPDAISKVRWSTSAVRLHLLAAIWHEPAVHAALCQPAQYPGMACLRREPQRLCCLPRCTWILAPPTKAQHMHAPPRCRSRETCRSRSSRMPLAPWMHGQLSSLTLR